VANSTARFDTLCCSNSFFEYPFAPKRRGEERRGEERRVKDKQINKSGP
jgi:hypothetical protein